MRKKGLLIFFVAACLVICAIPFGCMTFARTDTTTENKRLAEMPSLSEEGKFNRAFLSELGDYFNDHFAFRNQLVTADAEIQSRVFRVSNVDTVIRGEDGWLYYTATLDDYLGKTLSERGIADIAHNVAVMQDYVTDNGAKFLFAIAPNKNTLYGDHMPYYDSEKIGTVHNYELLTPKLEEEKISYLDLFSLFEEQDDVLYLRRDSHWNNQGALMVYDAMLTKLKKKHNDYTVTKGLRTKTEIGDLNSMLYPLTSQPEWNVYYEFPNTYSYVTDTKSVEDAWIETSNPDKKGSLLMYRDSFGNTLLPFMAEEFKKASFSKLAPYGIGTDMEQCSPKYVIVEKVERNLADLATDPPVLPAPQVKLKEKPQQGTGQKAATLSMREAEANMEYMMFDGIVPADSANADSDIYLMLETDDGKKYYDVFYTMTEDSDYGFRAYLPKDVLGEGDIQAKVLVRTDGTLSIACEEQFSL